MTKSSLIAALAPTPEPFETEWSQRTLAGILAADREAAARKRKARRVALVGLAAGGLTLSTAAAVAVGGPDEVVRRVITQFSEQPNTTGNGLGVLDDPELVAQFETGHGIFAFWIATSSSGTVCYAFSDGQWNGEGSPTEDQLEYGCGGTVWVGPDHPSEDLTRPEQLGGFFKDTETPILYGVSPHPDAVEVRVQGEGVDRTLPVRSDSHGYGAALPEAEAVSRVTLTFLDSDGRVLGTKRLVAPGG